MIHVGITGGIGSGKTTVAKIFEALGVPVLYADTVAKQLMNTSQPLQQELIQNFGAAIFQGQVLQTAVLAGIVFKNPEKLAQLNAIVHPAVIAYTQQWFQQQTTPYVIKEAALLFESGTAKGLQYVIGVTAPYALRVQRTMHRDGVSREQVLERMDKQINERIKMKLCDVVIENGLHSSLLPQVLNLHHQLLEGGLR
ncbi:MAG: dephospho-CoA kinase [Bacteroidetes bacterium]|nr:MAG: dephospho-CoA kinase [Bacteroidota bacterium]